jgi:hypothetical protein
MPEGVLVTVPFPDRLTVSRGLALDDPVPEPFTPREMVSPWAVKVTFPAKLPPLVGWKRTTTGRLAPEARLNDPPETTVNGAAAPTVTEAVELVVFWTVNVRSTLVPAATVPKATAPEGDTPRAGSAVPLAAAEHPLSLPERSTAETRTTYVAPAVSPEMVVLTRWLLEGVDVGEAIV